MQYDFAKWACVKLVSFNEKAILGAFHWLSQRRASTVHVWISWQVLKTMSLHITSKLWPSCVYYDHLVTQDKKIDRDPVKCGPSVLILQPKPYPWHWIACRSFLFRIFFDGYKGMLIRWPQVVAMGNALVLPLITSTVILRSGKQREKESF